MRLCGPMVKFYSELQTLFLPFLVRIPSKDNLFDKPPWVMRPKYICFKGEKIFLPLKIIFSSPKNELSDLNI